MKTLAQLALSGALVALSLPAAAQFAKPEDAVKYRQSSLFVMGQHFARVGAMANRSGSACLNSFTPRDKEAAGDWDRCRVVHGGGRRLRRPDRRGGQLGAHRGFSFYAAACIGGSSAQ